MFYAKLAGYYPYFQNEKRLQLTWRIKFSRFPIGILNSKLTSLTSLKGGCEEWEPLVIFGSLNEFVPTAPWPMVVFAPSYELERAAVYATAPAAWPAGPCPANEGSWLLCTGRAPPIMPWSSFWFKLTPRTSLRALSKLANSYWVFLDLLLYFKNHKMIRIEPQEETEQWRPTSRAGSPCLASSPQWRSSTPLTFPC